MSEKGATVTLWHKEHGPQSFYHVDAKHALRFKEEWKAKPWKGQSAETEEAEGEQA